MRQLSCSRAVRASALMVFWLEFIHGAVAISSDQVMPPHEGGANVAERSRSFEELGGSGQGAQVALRDGEALIALEANVQGKNKPRTLAKQGPPASELARDEGRGNAKNDESRTLPPVVLEEGASTGECARTPFLVRWIEEVRYPQPAVSHATEFIKPLIFADTEKRSKLRELLAEDAPQCRLAETSLRDTCAVVSEKSGLVLLPDRKALDEEGIDWDSLFVTVASLDGESIGQFLRRLLREYDLTYRVDDGFLAITTKSAMAQAMEARSYPIPFMSRDARGVVEAVLGVTPYGWVGVGGEGTIQQHDHVLVIRQTADCHEEVARLLIGLERSMGILHGTPCTRRYRVGDTQVAAEIAAALVSQCNMAIGDLADPKAAVTAQGGDVVVQSSSRPFLVYAEEAIAARVGYRATRCEWCAPRVVDGNVSLQGNVDMSARGVDAQSQCGGMGAAAGDFRGAGGAF